MCGAVGARAAHTTQPILTSSISQKTPHETPRFQSYRSCVVRYLGLTLEGLTTMALSEGYGVLHVRRMKLKSGTLVRTFVLLVGEQGCAGVVF